MDEKVKLPPLIVQMIEDTQKEITEMSGISSAIIGNPTFSTFEGIRAFREWQNQPGWWKPGPVVITDKGPELRKEAKVQCPGAACNKRERWVEWDKRGDTTCGACSGKMQYTGELRLV